MANFNKFVVIASVIAIAAILQVLLVFVDKKDTPDNAVVEFTKAYFKLDRSMSERLCKGLLENEEVDVVDEYLHQVAEQASAMGFELNYMRNQLYHIETKTHMKDDNRAEVRITGERGRTINPLYAFIGRLFFLIDTHKVDETIIVVKEDDQWKVCGKPFSLAEI